MKPFINYVRKPRASDGEDESANLAKRRVRTKAYEFPGERDDHLPLRTRYILNYHSYKIAIF